MKLNAMMTVALALLSGGCASLRSVSMTQVPADRARPIGAESSSWGFLGIFFTNSFADAAVKELQEKCPNGRITGVYTKMESRYYVLVTQRKVTAAAFCEPAATISARKI